MQSSGPQKFQVPIEEGLFTWPSDDPRLIGSKCGACGVITFPRQRFCPRCNGADMVELLLDRRGTLWTWTTQAFPPKAPPYAGAETTETFKAFGVGYIELPGQLKVEARLTESDPAQLRIGMKMDFVIVPLRIDEAGNEVMTFAFKPASCE